MLETDTGCVPSAVLSVRVRSKVQERSELMRQKARVDLSAREAKVSVPLELDRKAIPFDMSEL